MSEARFMAKVALPVDPEMCWPWTAQVSANGYGRFKLDGQPRLAHRVAYEVMVGPVPDGLTIDHTCHNGTGCPGGPTCPHRRCVNPLHLEPVPHRTNSRRGEGGRVDAAKTHCPQGHAYDEVNTYNWRGKRKCRTCGRARAAA